MNSRTAKYLSYLFSGIGILICLYYIINFISNGLDSIRLSSLILMFAVLILTHGAFLYFRNKGKHLLDAEWAKGQKDLERLEKEYENNPEALNEIKALKEEFDTLNEEIRSN